MYLPIARRLAIREALPFQSEYPSCAFAAARRDYAAARSAELAKIRNARANLAANQINNPGSYWNGFYGEAVAAQRRYLANIRAARRALIRVEG